MFNPQPNTSVATMPMALIIWTTRPVDAARLGAHASLPPRDVLALLGIVARDRRQRAFSDADGVTIVRRRAPWSRRRPLAG